MTRLTIQLTCLLTTQVLAPSGSLTVDSRHRASVARVEMAAFDGEVVFQRGSQD